MVAVVVGVHIFEGPKFLGGQIVFELKFLVGKIFEGSTFEGHIFLGGQNFRGSKYW